MTTTPLPQKTCIGVGYFDEHLFAYTEEQMIEYGKRCFADGMACKSASGSQYQVPDESTTFHLRKDHHLAASA